MVQGLTLHGLNVGDLGSIPGEPRELMPHAATKTWYIQIKKKKKHWIVLNKSPYSYKDRRKA